MDISATLQQLGKASDPAVLVAHSTTFQSFIATYPNREARGNKFVELRLAMERDKGVGALALLGLMEHESDLDLVSRLAFFAIELVDGSDEELGGAPTVIEFIKSRSPVFGWRGAAFAGVLNIGDKRINKLLLEAWKDLDESERMEVTKGNFLSPVLLEGILDFYLSCLEMGCTDGVFGAIIGAMCRMPNQPPRLMVGDFQRILPTYRTDGVPIIPIDTYPKHELLSRFGSRLEQIEKNETEPKLIPMVYQFWA